MQREKVFSKFDFIWKMYVNKKHNRKNYQKIPATSTLKQRLKIAIYVARYMDYLPLTI